MSIIYDALKKTQEQTNQTPSAQKPHSRFNKGTVLQLVVFIFFIGAGVYFGNFLFSYLKASEKNKKEKQTPQQIFITPRKEKHENSQKTNTTQNLKQVHQEEESKTEPKIKPTLNLNGIFYSGKDSWAIINNNIMQKDDSIEGAIVKEILEDEVILDFYGEEIRLK